MLEKISVTFCVIDWQGQIFIPNIYQCYWIYPCYLSNILLLSQSSPVCTWNQLSYMQLRQVQSVYRHCWTLLFMIKNSISHKKADILFKELKFQEKVQNFRRRYKINSKIDKFKKNPKLMHLIKSCQSGRAIFVHYLRMCVSKC